MPTPRLTQFSPGAGCGCKISPHDLESILKTGVLQKPDPKLLVGNEYKDDAAVYALDAYSALISTTDFFTPIVDNAYDFGRIAATNAISDIYAMGGKPVLAIAILGWPLDKLSTSIANEVLQGARAVCTDCAITLAGGHSISISDPVFGLAVNGIAPIDQIKRNNTAHPGDLIFITKPLGIGILSTAEKKGLLKEDHVGLATLWMCKTNVIGEKYGKLKYVTAMTDVTGFGLLGHLLEMCSTRIGAEINYSLIPTLPGLEEYIKINCFPGGMLRNWNSYGNNCGDLRELHRNILCDPQTSGGLLIAISPESQESFLQLNKTEGVDAYYIGQFTEPKENEPVIVVTDK